MSKRWLAALMALSLLSGAAHAKDAAERATLRATRAQQAAAEATRTGGIVPTPGLAALIVQLAYQGVDLKAGHKR